MLEEDVSRHLILFIHVQIMQAGDQTVYHPVRPVVPQFVHAKVHADFRIAA